MDKTHEHHDSAHCCFEAIESLACAGHCIHHQFCCCEEEGDSGGCACCEKSLELVLQAMEAHIACLRGVCTTRYAKASKGKAAKK